MLRRSASSPPRPVTIRFATAATAIAIASWASVAAAIPVRVRGEAAVRVIAFEHADATVVRGEVTDDVGATLPGARVEVDVGGAPRRASPCPDGPRGRIEQRGGVLVATSDDRGAFCVRIAPGPRRGASVRVSIPGGELFDGASAQTEVEGDAAGLAKTTLRFESPPEDVDLDRPTVRLTATLGVDRAEAERAGLTGVGREGLLLVVEDERGTALARATTGGDGRARFEVETQAMAGPGQGELRVRFDGTATLRPSRAATPVDRSARVALALASPTAAGDAEDGVPVAVAVTTARGPVDGGVVEASVGGRPAGAGPVVDGRATVVVTVPGRRPGVVPVSLRFVPSAPWYAAGPELATTIEIRPPSPLATIGLFALVAAVGIWVVQRWRRPPKPAHAVSDAAPRPPGHAEVVVVASAKGARGWRGRVLDAHDGSPVPSAEVLVQRPTFEGDGVAARVTTDPAGAFELTLDGAPPANATLRIEGALHAALEQPLPAPGELRIALVTRRRALLERLVRWARAKGSPWDDLREPTPGHVRRVAGRSEAADVADWAGAVEHAAFGPSPVDRDVEHQVKGREPGSMGR